jgi:hypothetical protein
MAMKKFIKYVLPETWLPGMLQHIDRFAQQNGYVRYNAVPNPVLDLRGTLVHPIKVLRRAENVDLLMDVPVDKIRDLDPVSPPLHLNPFYHTAVQYLETSRNDFPFEPLQRFYRSVVPAHAAEALGIKSARLESMDPLEAVLPWTGTIGPKAKISRHERSVRQAREYNQDFQAEDGDYSMGPMSERKIDLEAERVCRVIDSVRKRGYQPETIEDHIDAKLLFDNQKTGNWCVFIRSGTHRFPALAALGWTHIPIILRKQHLVKRSDAGQWPSVQNGVVSKEEALQIFDRVLNNRPISILKSLTRVKNSPENPNHSATGKKTVHHLT